jgi:hypothetical protein
MVNLEKYTVAMPPHSPAISLFWNRYMKKGKFLREKKSTLISGIKETIALD